MWWAYLLILGNTLFNVSGNVFIKLSADSASAGGFALWQVVGNLLTGVGVVSYSLSMKKLPLHIAYPLAQGLQVIGVTVVAGLIIFREDISLVNWAGVALITAGIVLFSLRQNETTEIIEEKATTDASAVAKE
jgi:multidrug transporter EmrE-like cation transporter